MKIVKINQLPCDINIQHSDFSKDIIVIDIIACNQWQKNLFVLTEPLVTLRVNDKLYTGRVQTFDYFAQFMELKFISLLTVEDIDDSDKIISNIDDI